LSSNRGIYDFTCAAEMYGKLHGDSELALEKKKKRKEKKKDSTCL